jgi:GT2 family glycosyltransferase
MSELKSEPMNTSPILLQTPARQHAPPPAALPAAPDALPADLDLRLQSRRPPRLSDEAAGCVARLPVPVAPAAPAPVAVPGASIAVVTYNSLSFTKMCLAAVLHNTEGPPFELIVVDNASTDGTIDYLRSVAAANPQVRLVLNDRNRGFAAANNQALALARGRLLVLLNNDTVPPPGWLTRLAAHLADPDVGLAGPVTNRIGNEAEVPATYATYGDMLRFADDRAARFAGQRFDIPVPCMFCLGMRRDAWETIGPLDERFEVGLLEDDDYARRAELAGYRLVCADDTFVHHFGQGSFGKLVPTGEYTRLLDANQRRYKEKWGRGWKPYGRRQPPEYAAVVSKVRDTVGRLVPPGAVVVVVSKGDEQLVDLDGRSGRHFPQDPSGAYAGFYPADGAAALAHLEALRTKGAQYLVVPATAAWWLDHYPALADHLLRRCNVLSRDEDLLLVELTEPSPARE